PRTPRACTAPGTVQWPPADSPAPRPRPPAGLGERRTISANSWLGPVLLRGVVGVDTRHDETVKRVPSVPRRVTGSVPPPARLGVARGPKESPANRVAARQAAPLMVRPPQVRGRRPGAAHVS